MKWKDIFVRRNRSCNVTTVSDDIVVKFPKPSRRLAFILQKVPCTSNVLYLYKLRRGISKDWIWWAMEMIEKGLQTSGIYQLAGEDLNMNPFKFSSLVEAIFQELDLDVTNDDAYYQYALWVAHQVLNGVISAENGFEKLARIAIDTDYHDAFMKFYYIEEDADLLRSHLPALYGNGSMHEDNMEEWMHLYFEKLIKLNECP